MKFDRTKYTAHYENGVVVAQWISIETSLDSSMGESPLDALDKSQELVQQWYKSKNLPFDSNVMPPPYGPSSVIQVKPEDREIGVTVEHIMSCDDLKTLDTYKFLVKGKEHLQNAFNTREKQIIQRMTKE